MIGLLSVALSAISTLMLTLAKMLSLFMFITKTYPNSAAIDIPFEQVSMRRTPDVGIGSPNSAARYVSTFDDSDTLQSVKGIVSFISPNFEYAHSGPAEFFSWMIALLDASHACDYVASSPSHFPMLIALRIAWTF